MPSILDTAFRYTPSAKTNIRATFRRERARLKAEAEARAAAERTAADQAAANAAEAALKVAPIGKARRGAA